MYSLYNFKFIKTLRDEHTTLEIKVNMQRLGRVISDEERKARSERMKT